MQRTLIPADVACTDEALAGGKGASLARLIRLGMNVPPFFVVSAEAYRERRDSDWLNELREDIRRRLAELGDGPVAVRSSAIGEDSQTGSFAGLYHTSLNVEGLDAVLAAIRTCWASYDSSAASAYRAQRGGDHALPGMAVVVQSMVDAEYSGVCFTADPVRNALARGVINATCGLGERLVAGDVNPDQLVVRAADGVIVSRRAGDGASELPVTNVNAVWEASAMIAREVDFPQDVEWAVRDGEVFILQSRPITTIGDVFYSRMIEPWRDNPAARPDDSDRVFSRAYADEIWTPPVSPLFYNVQNLSASFTSYLNWHHDQTPVPADVFKYYRATPYVDVAVLQRQYEYHPRFSRIAGILNFFPASQRNEVRRAPFRWRGRLWRTLHFEFRQRRLRSLANNYRYIRGMWPTFVRESDTWFDMDLDALSLEELRKHFGDVGGAMARTGPACGFAVAYHAHDLTFILTGLLDRWCGDGDALYSKVSSGLDESETVGEAAEIWRLGARLAELGPEILSESASRPWADFRDWIVGRPGGESWLADFDAFWHAHRHRGANYKDLVYPRWGDDPELLFQIVRSGLERPGPDPRAENALQADVRRAEQSRIIRSLHGPKSLYRRAILRWLFRYNEIYMAERDNHRFYFDRSWYELRRIYLSMGARLVAAGVLRHPGDVFYLGASEVESALAGKLNATDMDLRVGARRAEWERTRREQPPKFITGYTALVEAADMSAAGVIRGIAASPGIAVGRARILYDVSELPRVEQGDIVVTRQTDPSWTVVFPRIGGLVLETGGVLAHGTSLCREYGIPCVTAVERAMELIPEGALVEVGGVAGIVKILTRSPGE